MRVGSFGWQLLELAGWSGLQACFGGAFDTSNSSLHLVLSRDEALSEQVKVASNFA